VIHVIGEGFSDTTFIVDMGFCYTWYRRNCRSDKCRKWCVL